MKITTNHHWRDLVCWYDLPENWKSEFDYIEGEDMFSLRLFRYRDYWYDTGEFFTTSELSPPDFHRWHGYQSDSYFTGTLIRYSKDYNQVQVGSYIT